MESHAGCFILAELDMLVLITLLFLFEGVRILFFHFFFLNSEWIQRSSKILEKGVSFIYFPSKSMVLMKLSKNDIANTINMNKQKYQATFLNFMLLLEHLLLRYATQLPR